MNSELRGLVASAIRSRSIRWRERTLRWIDSQESTPRLRDLTFSLLTNYLFWPEPEQATPRHRRR